VIKYSYFVFCCIKIGIFNFGKWSFNKLPLSINQSAVGKVWHTDRTCAPKVIKHWNEQWSSWLHERLMIAILVKNINLKLKINSERTKKKKKNKWKIKSFIILSFFIFFMSMCLDFFCFTLIPLYWHNLVFVKYCLL